MNLFRTMNIENKQKFSTMKKTLLIITLVGLFIGCNINPNKEARIQKLETEIQLVTDKVKELENKIQTLEVMNEQLKTRVHDHKNL